MLQAYVPNVPSVLDVCCSESTMLQVFHEAGKRAQAVPIERCGWASRHRLATGQAGHGCGRAAGRGRVGTIGQ